MALTSSKLVVKTVLLGAVAHSIFNLLQSLGSTPKGPVIHSVVIHRLTASKDMLNTVSHSLEVQTVFQKLTRRIGRFTMNMIQAYGAAAVLTNVSTNSGAAEVGPPSSDNDYTAIAHAVFTCIAFVIMMPLGVIFLRILERVRWHWINELLALLVAFIGLVIGIYLSTTYNKSKSFNSAHQLIGILVILALFLQAWLGWHHHQVYKRIKRTTPYAPVHRFFGCFLILAGLANGAVGLDYAKNNSRILVYLVISIILVGLVATWVLFNRWWVRRGGRNGIHESSRYESAPQPFSSDVHLELVRGL